MFQAVLHSSSRDQIVLLQHLASSLSVNGRTVCWLTVLSTGNYGMSNFFRYHILQTHKIKE